MTLKEKLAAVGAALLALLYALFRYEKGKRQEAEAQVANAAYNTTDAVLEEKQKELKRQQDAAIAIKEVELGRTLSREELKKVLDDL